MKNQHPQFKEHEIEWDDKKNSNLWNYYSNTPPYCDNYFAKVFGKYILKKTGLPLKRNLSILDFGCSPRVSLGSLVSFKSTMELYWD